jgi:hypothetical protein
LNIGELIDDLQTKRLALQTHLANEKRLRDDYNAAERAVMAALNEAGLTSSRAKTASVSVTESQVANVENWDAFYGYLLENEALYLLQRRVASKAVVDEVVENGVEIPGIGISTIRKLGVRTL